MSIKVAAIIGSNRKESYNRKLVEYMKKRYADKFGAPMKIQDSIYGYDAMMMVAESINSRGYSAEQIRDGLRDIRYVGLSGAIVFDESGDRYPVYDVMQVRNGEWVVLPWSEVMSFEAGHH